MPAVFVQLAIADLTGFSVVNSIAVTNTHSVLSTESPNAVLQESRKVSWKRWVDGACVDEIRNGPDYFSAAALAVAGRAIAVGHTAVVKDASAMQKVMHERVDSDH